MAVAALAPIAAGATGATGQVLGTARGATEAAPPAGTFATAGAPLRDRFSRVGDMIAAGWSVTMPGHHPATTVALSGITATIPFLCLTWDAPSRRSLVISMPDASVSVPADDSGWHVTSSTTAAAGYQAAVALPQLCANGLVLADGNVAYSARLVSADTAGVFAVRFHAVDGASGIDDTFRHPRGHRGAGGGGHRHQATNIDCASPTQNPGAPQCYAAWSRPAENTAAPVPSAVGSTPGTGPGAGAPRPPLAAPKPAVHPAAAPSPARLGSVTPASVAPIPVLLVPMPSGPTVLGPVPVVLPVIASGGSPAATALPWWFALLALVDLALIVGIVLRRRRGHDDPTGAP